MTYFFGNFTAFFFKYTFLYEYLGYNVTTVPMDLVNRWWRAQLRYETTGLMKFYSGIFKSFGYPIGLVLQIMTVIFLVRGNSGYSRSAKNWFLLVLYADIFSVLYRFYDLVTYDYNVINPIYDDDYNAFFGQHFIFFMWGLRRMEDAEIQSIMCNVFFVILYIPIHLSPIALTVSSIIRSYCVKFPLKAKAVLTTRIDRCLMGLTFVLSLAISAILGSLAIKGWSAEAEFESFNGMVIYYGECIIPTYVTANTDKGLLFVGLTFMLSIIFIICSFNLLSSIIIIFVLFEAKKNRRSMSATDQGSDSKAEIRATAMLLGMNLTLFACFFLSRVMAVTSARTFSTISPQAFAVMDRLGSYLFNIPYYTNFLFISGLNRKFYEFFFPCLINSDVKSATNQKSIEETKLS